MSSSGEQLSSDASKGIVPVSYLKDWLATFTGEIESDKSKLLGIIATQHEGDFAVVNTDPTVAFMAGRLAAKQDMWAALSAFLEWSEVEGHSDTELTVADLFPDLPSAGESAA